VAVPPRPVQPGLAFPASHPGAPPPDQSNYHHVEGWKLPNRPPGIKAGVTILGSRFFRPKDAWLRIFESPRQERPPLPPWPGEGKSMLMH